MDYTLCLLVGASMKQLLKQIEKDVLSNEEMLRHFQSCDDLKEALRFGMIVGISLDLYALWNEILHISCEGRPLLKRTYSKYRAQEQQLVHKYRSRTVRIRAQRRR